MDLREQLQTTLEGVYSVERELGGGGMSRVFLATETGLGRHVVIKVLSAELGADVSVERFTREIKLAARLQHANIVPLLSAGQTNGVPYYTMPYVEGQSLRERLTRAGPPPVTETVSILRDVARALAYAHEHGVVHRDIKPDNVLLSGDAAVVTDFGIAKALTAARTGSTSSTLTQAGIGIGTPAYIAPEQASGDPAVDHRADIYAFGCMAYELLTGQPPFHDRPPHKMLAAHLGEKPRPVAEVRSDTPAGLAALVDRALEKDPALRPQNAREIMQVLETVHTPEALAAPPPVSGRRRRITTGALVVAVAAVTVVAIAAVTIWRSRGGGPAAADGASLAVLPFANVGGDSAQDYLADGMSDELATAIGKLPGVRLATRSVAYHYRGRRDLDVRELGKALGVKYVVQGSVRGGGSRLRVSAQMSDASTGVELWSDTYERESRDVFAVQDDITRAITEALKPRLSRPVAAPAQGRLAHGTLDPEAYDLYLRGEYLLRRRVVRLAAEHFERAIARDSSFARAHAGLSHALELYPYFAGVAADSVFVRATGSARRALALDSTLAEPHMSLGMAYMHAWRWAEARTELVRAVALDPNEPDAVFQYGRFLYYQDLVPEALAEWERAKALDPYSGLFSVWVSRGLQNAGRAAEALAELRRAMELDSLSVVVAQVGSQVYFYAGKHAEAVAVADRMSQQPPWVGMKAYIHAKAGDREPAVRIVRDLERTKPMPWFGNSALAYAYIGLGDTTRALDALERATDAREIWPTYHRTGDAIYDPIRRSARFQALLRRVGLADHR